MLGQLLLLSRVKTDLRIKKMEEQDLEKKMVIRNNQTIDANRKGYIEFQPVSRQRALE